MLLKGLAGHFVDKRVNSPEVLLLKELGGPRGGRPLFGGTEESCRLNNTIIAYWYLLSSINYKYRGLNELRGEYSRGGIGIEEMTGAASEGQPTTLAHPHRAGMGHPRAFERIEGRPPESLEISVRGVTATVRSSTLAKISPANSVIPTAQ